MYVNHSFTGALRMAPSYMPTLKETQKILLQNCKLKFTARSPAF